MLFASPRTRLFFGAALISLSPVWVRLVEVSPTTSGFYRVIIGGIALALLLIVQRKGLGLSRRTWLILGVATVFFALDVWFWHRSIVLVGPGLSTLLANFQVFFLLLAGILLFGQKPRVEQIVAVPLALLGLSLIIGVDWGALTPDYRAGVIYGLLTAVMYAGYILSLRWARSGAVHRVPIREIAVVSFGCAIFLGGAAVLEGESLVIPTWIDVGWLLGYGILSHALGWLFIASSLPQVSTTEAGLALLLQPSLSFFWDIALFARPVTGIELAGAAIALAAIYLGSRDPDKRVAG